MSAQVKKTVAIIEDEEPLLASYSEILESGGYEVVKGVDGYKGLESLEKEKGDIDVILLDLMMPGMDGLEVLRTIKDNPGKYGSAPVVVLTNMTSERVIKEAFDLGASSYLIKTELEVDDLIREVEKVLGKEEK